MPISSLLILVLLLAMSAVMLSIHLRREVMAQIGARMESFATRATVGVVLPSDLEQPFAERVLKPLMRSLVLSVGSRSSASSHEKIRLQLARAGNPGRIGPAEFLGLKLLLTLGLPLSVFGFFVITEGPMNVGFMIAGGIGMIGFRAPYVWLDRLTKERKAEITKVLPDAIDLLTISVESGLGFDPAMMRVADKWDNALSHEFSRCLSEMRVGKSKREAMREMAERVDEEGLTTFVGSIVQADQLGVPITQILRVQSTSLRAKRRQRAEVKAQKAPLKMLFPMILFIFPAIYIIILGPAIPLVMKSFK